jgi:hypothetical protein
VQYSPEYNQELADEIGTLPGDYSAISKAITDYAKLRDRIRKCEREKDKI